MRTPVLFLLRMYSVIFSPLIHQVLGVRTICRHEQSCSKFAHEAITEYGLRRGLILSAKRLTTCQPFAIAL